MKMVTSLTFYILNSKKSPQVLILKNSRIIKVDEAEGQQLTEKFDKVVFSGFKITNQPGIRIFYKRITREFYIEIITKDLDSSDRPAKIGIYSRKPTISWQYNLKDWIYDVFDQIEKFSVEHERSVSDKHLDIISTSLREIYYKDKQAKLLLRISRIIVASLTPILLGLIIQFFSSRTGSNLSLENSLESNTTNLDSKITFASYLIAINNLLLIVLYNNFNNLDREDE
ncbi:MAG: hypothetical protein F6J89_22490 [Symploca sp. SIO1C4]|uniref:Uncharacterized protein n=1 Tax=Symploca sp. SIO1C4 TaxID=2607765 RepID=A0A6B3NHJ4_9CYAN|nr:hypothetical protein [Symploca sp. SIO1C4]